MPRVPLSLSLFFFIAYVGLRRGSEAITLPGSETSYARYPRWNDCLNASFSFEFKSTQSDKGQVLLWYVDDGGTYDFFEVTMINGRVRLVLNIVDGKDGNVEINVGHGVNDGRWHKVEVKRRRMETSLKVDGIVESRFSFGSDFYFGRGHNSYVYIGGLPSDFTQHLAQLALPSSLFHQRLKGSVRNILYGNCSCHTQRGVLIDGVGVSQFPPESCELRNPCREGCVCITTDAEPQCDCSELQCVTGTVTHYQLPMDRLSGTTLVNPSGLDATAFGAPPLTRGIQGSAIETNGRDKYIRVSGPGHRFECFGDLNKCPNGYTLSFWANFTVPVGDGDFVYLSNGGHSSRSHGVAMTYGSNGRLEFIFKKPNGDEWRASANGVLPGRWHHIAASWSASNGLSLYINGDVVSTTSVASRGQPVAVNASGGANDFVIGKSNEVTSSAASGRRSMIVDEFNFWSMYKNITDIRENGPFYRYYLPLNSRNDIEIGGNRFSVQGNPQMVNGKMGNALQFDGQRDFISGGNFGNSCLGNLMFCQYGVTAGMWIKFNDLRENAYLLSTGKNGIELYYKDGRLTAEVQQGSKNWKASWTKPDTGRWYFLELTWNPDDGLDMLADLESVAKASNYQRKDVDVAGGTSNLFIGRANSEGGRYAAVTIDDLELWYGDRERLIYFDFIQRGKPPKENFGMDAIVGNRVSHPRIRIDTFGLPRIVPGRIGGALNLDGSNEFASMGKQQEACLGNLDLCRHGLLLSAWLRPGQLKEGMDLMSSGSNGLRMWYEGGKLKVSARTSAREWDLETDRVRSDQWQFIEVAWHPDDGLRFYVNEERVAQSTSSTVRADPGGSNPDREQFYFGRGDGSRSNARYGNFSLDDVEYWNSNRDYLIAFDYIQRGKPQHYLIDMDSVRGGRIEHSSLTIPVNGNPVNVPGKINNAIRLDGNGQYADVGDHGDSCFGNMKLCNHGITGSMFLNFRNFEENMYYLTSGGGMRLYYADGKLYASVDRAGQRWEVGIPYLRKDKWYFVEYTWHPEKGLQVYVDNKLAGDTKQPARVPVKQFSGEHVLIGSANPGDSDDGGRFRYANALVDEVETWLGNRDNLIAFDYIIRDNVTHLVFPLEQQRGNKVIHPDYSITLHNGATLVPGKVGRGALLEGTGEYLSFGDQYDNCMGNLEMCRHGMTVSFFLKPKQILNNAYYLSGGPYSVYSKDGKFYAKFSTSNRTWEVSTDRITVDNWHKMELSWDEEKGLEMYVNKEKVASTKDYRTHPPLRITDHTVHLGRPNEDVSDGRYADAIVDELEYWFANRDILKTLNLIGDEINHLIIDMDRIRGDTLVHPKTVIYVSGNPHTQPGIIGNAVTLNGRNQYIDAGQDVICGGNIQTCAKGFTLRFKMKPNQLQDNTYFVSSRPVDVYYQNNRLVAEVRTPTTVWRTSTPNLRRDAWHQVDVSWHPVDGLVMYVNSQQVDRQTVGLSYDGQYDDGTKHFYIGRANTDMIRERYANAVFDDLQIWEAKRDYLIPDLIDPDVDVSLIRDQSTVRPTVTSTTTRRPIIIPTLVPTDGNKWLVFDGHSWILYDFSQLPDEYLQKNSFDTFNIRFKTDSPDGLLWYTGRDDHHSHLTLKDGVLYLISNSTSDIGRYLDTFRVQVPSGRLNDNKWHNVQIIKEEHEVRIIVDGNEFRKRFVSDVDLINPNFVYLAGSNRTRDLTNFHISRNFEGIIDKAVLNGDTLPNELDLINLYLIKPRPNYIFIDGNVIVREPDEPTAPPAPEPITFTTGQAYVRLPRWDATRSGSIEFHFKTFEPNGLILFNGGQPDSFSLELFDGQPYVNLDLGGGVYKYPFETRSGPVNDGRPHHIVVQRRGRHLRLTLDGDERVHTIVGGDDDLDLGSHLYIGAVDSPSQVPWHVWSRDRKFFRGCFWGLRINDGEMIDLESYVRNQVMPGIEPGCLSTPPQCPSRPCVNGVCLERFDGFRCDCSATPYTGDRCQKAAPIAGFSGNEYVRINFRPTRVTHTNDISLRFKTPKENGLLFATSSRGTDDYLRVLLDKGQGKIETNLGGQKQLSFGCDQPLNDNKWHTLYIRRRANHLEAFIDNCTSESTTLPGSGYTLDVDEILIARRGSDDPAKNSFIGHIQNFYFDDLKFIEMIGGENVPGIFIDSSRNITTNETHLYVYPVTFRRNPDSFVVLPALQIVGDTNIRLLVKTADKDGLLLYNEGSSNNFFAVELVNGILHVSANDGSGPKVITSSAPQLADNRWHSIDIRQTDRQTFEVLVDNRYPMQLTFPSSRNTLNLVDVLHVGGVPSSIWSRLPSGVASRTGFSGCMASFIVNGQLYDLMNDGIGTPSQYITGGCTDTRTFCTEGICQHHGVCREGLNTFICDCNMTSFVGERCTAEAEGYRYGFENRRGITVFSLTPPQTTTMDRLAFGFMTWYPNGTLVRIESSTSTDYIDAKLVNGNVVFTYDIGDGPKTVAETRRTFNDGQYHYVSFIRNGPNATLRVDDFPVQQHLTSSSSATTTFDDIHLVKIGGNVDRQNNIIDHFNGIVSGVYLNGYRVIDLGVIDKDGRVKVREDTIIASHPFFVAKPTTEDPVIPPTEPVKPDPGPDVINGGGGGWDPIGEGNNIIIIPGNPEFQPVVAAAVGAGDVGEGARAAAVAGAMLGILAAASSIAWAFYKFKPGLIGAGGGGPGGLLNISAPVSSTSYRPVNTQDTPLTTAKGGGGTTGAASSTGAATGKKYGSTSFMTTTKADMANGAAAGGGSSVVAHMGTQTAGGGTTNFSEYFSYSSSSAAAAGGASSTAIAGHKPGTTTRAIQTDLVYQAPGGAMGGGSSASYNTTVRDTTVTNIFNNQQMAGGGYGAADQGYGGQGYVGQGYGDAYGASTMSYDASRAGFVGAGQQEFHGYSATDGGYGAGQQGVAQMRAISPPPTDPNSLYQMRSMTLNYSAFNQQNIYGQQQQQQQLQQLGGVPGTAGVRPNLMAEEIRVDCVQMTNNGRYVVTGSIFGPPQVWDMKTGELIRIMQGDDFSSTDLHLANGDTLLVGQVAELEQADLGSNVHYRKLQLWDFNTGRPLEMRKNELCTASCLMSDGERMVLGRTEKYGGGTTIIIWDVLGNEPLRQIKYDGSVGFADQISYLNLSKDNRYVIAGFQNSFDQKANFISFDLTVNDFHAIPPQITVLDAQAEVTAVLENQEAVTGTRSGELIIWSMRTGKPLRQLVSPSRDVFSQSAHQRQVTDLCVSKDGQFLVSASADTTLKVWDLESEKLLRTLSGHKDEVWCCTVSNDNELVVSGSRDCTIRLWRLDDGVPVAAIDAGVDVFKVLLSNNKKTVVALADKYGARKLVMLQIVRTKVRSAAGSRTGSRATSPFISDEYHRF